MTVKRKVTLKRWSFKAKRSKYGVSPKAERTVDGIIFDSKKEAQRYRELQLAKKSGSVEFFLRQVPFDLSGGIKYRLDFLVFWADGKITFEDVKGCRTEIYKLKKKQVESLYPVEITEN